MEIELDEETVNHVKAVGNRSYPDIFLKSASDEDKKNQLSEIIKKMAGDFLVEKVIQGLKGEKNVDANRKPETIIIQTEKVIIITGEV